MTAWSNSDWHLNQVQSDSKKVAYIERLKAWGKGWKPKIDVGFDGKLQILMRAAPKPSPKKALKQAVPSAKGGEITRKLKRLKKPYDQGLITEADYAGKRKQLLKGL